MREFKTREIADWWNYFHSLTRRGLLPDRVALNPAEVRHLLPNMMIFDLSDPAAVRFRLVGTAITERYGFDPTGTNFIDLLDAGTREESRQVLHAAVRHPFGVFSLLRSKHGGGLTAEVEALSFPFLNGPGAVPQLVTVSVRVRGSQKLEDDPETLKGVESQGLSFIDLGAGLPEGLPES